MPSAANTLSLEPTCLSAIIQDYDLILCDIWGVLHNGRSPWPTADDALSRARAQNIPVILISNSPRPEADVLYQLDMIGVRGEAFDAIVTSGDVTRDYVRNHYKNKPISHFGPGWDASFFHQLDNPLVSDKQARAVVCTGLDEERYDTLEEHRPRLQAMRDFGLPLICANPDTIVEVGDSLIYCAGALAELYEEMGGETVYLGKPHAPIYQAALKKAEKLKGASFEPSCILTIGDSIANDCMGAKAQGYDCLFITGGIHAGDFGAALAPDPYRIKAYLQEAGVSPIGWSPRLRW
jgi:HAD superfamily hydrolase (TIGR01459 family)